MTREPGGSPGAEAVRHVLLSGAAEPFGPAMEAILFAAARSDHVEQRIRPAVERGEIVLCDRFLDSTRVYQGVTGELDREFVEALEAVAINGMMPDMTLVLDLDPELGLKRALERRGEAVADRFEKEDLAVHQRRREAYLAIAAAEPERCIVIDASGELDQVEKVIAAAVFAAHRGAGLRCRRAGGRIDVRAHRPGAARFARRRSRAGRDPARVRASGAGSPADRRPSRRQAAACAGVCRPARHRQGEHGIPARALSARPSLVRTPRRTVSRRGDPASSLYRQVASGAHPSLLHLTRPFDEKNKKFKTALTVDEIRRVGRFLSLTAHDGGYRIVIVDPADDMNTNAANALLKNLEEPPSRTLFVLVAHSLGRLLPTIRSRCQIVRLQPLGDADLLAALAAIGKAPEPGPAGRHAGCVPAAARAPRSCSPTMAASKSPTPSTGCSTGAMPTRPRHIAWPTW